MWLIGNLLDVLRMSFPKAAQSWRKQYGPVFKVTLRCCPGMSSFCSSTRKALRYRAGVRSHANRQSFWLFWQQAPGF